MIIQGFGAAPASHVPARRASGLQHPFRRILFWLRAEPRDVISFTQRPSGPATPDSVPTAGALQTDLGWWQRRIGRYRVLALLRRSLIGAALLALVLAVLTRIVSSVPIWVVLALPALLLVVTLIARHRRPSLGAVARLLDHNLALKDQVASALAMLDGQLGVSTPLLGQRLESRATTLVAHTRTEWRVRLAPARGEWISALLLCAAVALVLVLPRTHAYSGAAPRTATQTVAIANDQVGNSPAFVVPSVPASAPLHMRVNVAVISTPVPKPTPRIHLTARARAQQHLVVTARNANGTSSTRQGAPKSGTAALKLPSGAGATSQLGQPAAKSNSPIAGQANLPLLTNRHLLHPAAVNGGSHAVGRGSQGNGTPSKQGAAAGSSKGLAAKSLNGPSLQTRRGANGSVGVRGGASNPGANSKIGGAGRVIANPYSNGSNVPNASGVKPGLISGKTQFSGKASPGNSTPGHGRGSTSSQTPQTVLPTVPGHQLTLQSAYGAARNGRSGRTLSGSGTGTGSQSASVSTTGGSDGAIDYVPPDANLVAPDDRGIVSNYFTPRAGH